VLLRTACSSKKSRSVWGMVEAATAAAAALFYLRVARERC
jgi:hypothetical protein